MSKLGARTADGSPPAAVLDAARAAAKFNRSAVSVAGGLLAAVPVVVLLGAGLAFGDRVAAVTMGAGAMLVGSAWRTGGGRPPLALMATDAVGMALSTFIGSATGAQAWVHLALLCLWSLVAGLLVAVGRRGAVLGTQAIIAVVVFGRFSQPPAAALGIAGLVLAGGLAQVLFQLVVRWPSPLRAQRMATAAAYRVLGELAAGPADASSLPAAAALDDAQDALASGTLFGDPVLTTLRSLVSEGQRLRVQLAAIHGLTRRHGATGDLSPPAYQAAERALQLTQAALLAAAQAIEGDDSAGDELDQRVRDVGELAGAPWSDSASAPADTAVAAADRSSDIQLDRRLAALGGQLRAVASMAPAAGASGRLRSRRPQPRTNQPLQRLRADLDQIRANASVQSPAGRHALRLAVVVPAAEIISRYLPISRGYWMVVAAATVLRPEFAATFTRGTERAAGTALGVALAGAIAVGLHPGQAATVGIVAVLAVVAYATFPASFAVGFSFITALVVFLLNAINPDTLSTASARLLDTLVGGTFGALVYALWPTWAQVPARRALAELISAQREYLGGVLSALAAGKRADAEATRQRSRRARLARTKAESVVATSLSEPATHRVDSDWSQAVLATARRLVQAAHVLRLDAEDDRDRHPLPALAPLAADIESLLRRVQSRIEGPPDAPPAEAIPDLRATYTAYAREAAGDREAAPLLGELDEIVDAVNGLGALVGLDVGDVSGAAGDGQSSGAAADAQPSGAAADV